MKQSTNSELINAFVEMKARRRSPKTAIMYAKTLKIFSDAIGDTPVCDIRAPDIEKFVASCADRGVKPNSINSYLRVLKVFYSYLFEYEYMERNPMKKIETLNEPSSPRKYLTDEQVSIMVLRASCNPNYEFMVNFLLNTGLRVGEFCALKLEDIDLDACTVKVIHGKGDKYRMVALPESTRTLLIKRKKALNLQPHMPIWGVEETWTQSMFRTLSDWSGFKITPHMLRHTFATRIYRQTGDIGCIQTLLGHTRPDTSAIYAKYDSNAAMMIQRAHAL